MFGKILLFYGVCELIFGLIICIRKNEYFGKMLVTLFYRQSRITYEDIKEKEIFIKWFGEKVALSGSMYIMLAATAIRFNMNIVVLIIFLILIEIIIINMLKNGVKDFL